MKEDAVCLLIKHAQEKEVIGACAAAFAQKKAEMLAPDADHTKPAPVLLLVPEGENIYSAYTNYLDESGVRELAAKIKYHIPAALAICRNGKPETEESWCAAVFPAASFTEAAESKKEQRPIVFR